MKISRFSLLSYCIVLTLYFSSWLTSSARHDHSIKGFLQCLFQHSKNHKSISHITYTENNASYTSILRYSIQNLRYATPTTPKPAVIITPLHEDEIPPIIYCAKKHDIQIRVRSGGHDYEGLSYASEEQPFVMVDLLNLRLIDIDAESRTAWIQSGATTGEFYYRLAQKSQTLGFPSSICLNLGIGGYFSGGGYGSMVRKYGLAADNVIDARLVDVNGKIVDRKSMGEDVFWAIRGGGGGGSFGVVLAWKVQLVTVPKKVTVFRVLRTLYQNATALVHRWQYVAPKFPEELYVTAAMNRVSTGENFGTTIQVTFTSTFLGGVDRLIPLMQKSFPELGLVEEDCTEMSWVESALYFQQIPRGTPLEILLNRSINPKQYFKAKSDFVQQPMPIKTFEGMWKLFFEKEAEGAFVLFGPFGGKNDEISDSATPFPHRAGNLYIFQHVISWDEEGVEESKKYIQWINKHYKYVTPYVSKSPRASYVNYRDLDLGVNNKGRNSTSYAKANIWGRSYFKVNFKRLAQVKTMVDPTNFFRNEQSIPILSS